MAEDPVARITDRFRKDQPDPAEREKFYVDDKLTEYVRVLAPDADESEIARVAKAVRAAEDDQSYA